MTTKPDGGPAFPCSRDEWRGGICFPVRDHGMTLRDIFAAAALTGFIASPDTDGTYSDYASDAYQQADAMLAERDK